MKILIACEFSGRVREAFIKRGHDAISCDFRETEIPGPHYQGNVLDIIDDGFDMMVGFPDCTHLASSGARHFKNKVIEQIFAELFFKRLWFSSIPMIAIENPIGVMSTLLRKPDQIIQPYMFGHMEQKATCVWLKGLPLLIPTLNVYCDMLSLPKRERERVHYMSPSADRSKERSRTYLGIADAMASQWG